MRMDSRCYYRLACCGAGLVFLVYFATSCDNGSCAVSARRKEVIKYQYLGKERNENKEVFTTVSRTTIIPVIALKESLRRGFSDPLLIPKSSVYITLTTIPQRIKSESGFKRVLSCAIAQDKSWPVVLSVPEISMRQNLSQADKFDFSLPAWLCEFQQQHADRLFIIATREYGPATKLLGLANALLHVWTSPPPQDTKIITFDDDRCYGSATALALVTAAASHRGSIISHAAITDQAYPILGEPIGHEWKTAGYGNRLQGCGGVLYEVGMIAETWFHPSETCIWEDDTWLSMRAHAQNISIYIPGLANNATIGMPEVGMSTGGLSLLHRGSIRECRSEQLALLRRPSR
eukprot:m.650261 g.650261  ORF g.650261 m.650261 type:complete len:348 (-) comp22670_c2_seq12:121-1164(-)